MGGRGERGETMDRQQLHELLYQALETEQGGIKVYETALRCVQNADLRQEWEEYLDQTQKHEQILLEVFEKFGLDPDEESPGRLVVRHKGQSLVHAMEIALDEGEPGAASSWRPNASSRPRPRTI